MRRQSMGCGSERDRGGEEEGSRGEQRRGERLAKSSIFLRHQDS